MDITLLNEQQEAVVRQTDGKKLVISAPGSGKTYCITYQVAYLIEECRVSPDSILAVTFTRKAANEMKERIAKLVETNTDGLWIGTFHSICVKLLRKYFRVPYFSIVDEDEQQQIMKDILERHTDIQAKASQVLFHISEAKDLLLSPDNVLTNDKIEFPEEFVKLYTEYQATLKSNRARDFDDLIYDTIRMLREDNTLATQLKSRFKYVICDEGQDSSYSNYELINLLSTGFNNLMIVADHDQSIYGWRGAKPDILHHFAELDETQTFNLGANYRCSNNIVQASNKVIEQNTKRLDKISWTENDNGSLICYYQAPDNFEEAKQIVNVIKYLIEDEEYNYDDFTILYRNGVLSRDIEQALMQEMIPYDVIANTSFFKRKEIKEVICYLRLLLNDKDFIALTRVLSAPKCGIGDVAASKIFNYLTENKLSFADVSTIYDKIPRFPKKAIPRIEKILKLVDEYKIKLSENNEESQKTIIQYLIDLEYIEYLEDSEDFEERVPNVFALIDMVGRFSYETTTALDHIDEFVQYINLVTDADAETDRETVKLMTIHAAKGLENTFVFLVGLDEGTLPSIHCLSDEDKVEEERRLFYVAMTRAKKGLFLSSPMTRYMFGKPEKRKTSRFLKEIPKRYVQRI